MAMTVKQIQGIAKEALELVRAMSPIDTGNLRYNGIRIDWPNARTFRISVDEHIAPYMPYTNEAWEHKLIKMGNFVPGQIVERMRTWDNPNEGWWDRAARAVAELVAAKTGGTLQ